MKRKDNLKEKIDMMWFQFTEFVERFGIMMIAVALSLVCGISLYCILHFLIKLILH